MTVADCLSILFKSFTGIDFCVKKYAMFDGPANNTYNKRTSIGINNTKILNFEL